MNARVPLLIGFGLLLYGTTLVAAILPQGDRPSQGSLVQRAAVRCDATDLVVGDVRVRPDRRTVQRLERPFYDPFGKRAKHRLEFPEGAVTQETVFRYRVERTDSIMIEIEAVGQPTFTFPNGRQPTLTLDVGRCPVVPANAVVRHVRTGGTSDLPVSRPQPGRVSVEIPSLSLFMLASP